MMTPKLTIIAGNCILESKKISSDTASFLKEMSEKFKFDLIYKSSFLKDNRSSWESYTGLGINKSIEIFEHLKKEFNVQLLTDISKTEDLQYFNHVIDMYQIPAYLCMQSELLVAMAETQKPINIKKGQFLHPEDVAHIVRKIEKTGNKKIMITERGTCFGYRDLVLDPRSLHMLQQFGYPVFFDVGHSVRKYGISSSDKRGGNKEFITTLAKSAIVTGIQGLFVEVHPNPKKAKCDAITQLSFQEFEDLMKKTVFLWVVNKAINGDNK